MFADPLLEGADIQGHVLIGFGGGVQSLLGLRLRSATLQTARSVLGRWADRVTSCAEANVSRGLRRAAKLGAMPLPDTQTLYVAMSLSAEGLARLDGGDGPEDPHFRRGAAANAFDLHDPVDGQGRPIGWLVGGTPETTPDVFVVLGGDREPIVHEGEHEFLRDLGDLVDIVYRESGRRLGRETEHFGFADGIAQPGIRGSFDGAVPITRRVYPPDHPLADIYARPGQPLVWPGQFVFGYATQKADSALPGKPLGGSDPLLRNGSLLVFRRLRQDVAGFEAAMKVLAASFAAKGLDVLASTVAAWCVGRWKDGTPVSVSPGRPDDKISGDFFRRDGFLYDAELAAATLNDANVPVQFPGATADPNGFSCPFFSHIRKVNPRDRAVDQGSSGVTLQTRMLRRGIPYGPDWPGSEDGADRGLLFMAYQTSIAGQFNRLMSLWVNNAQAPPPGEGIDPLIGFPAAPADSRPLLRRTDTATAFKVMLPGRWVIPTGAGYFFSPGIRALKKILAGPESQIA
jgi:Dyp-type peroxidase family